MADAPITRRAVAIWRPLAEKGDADAAFNLGQAYRLGRGVPINLGAAKTWFERAADKGHLDAQTTLGLLLFRERRQDRRHCDGSKSRPRKASPARCWSTAPRSSTATVTKQDPAARLRLCQPRRRAGAGARQGDACAARSRSCRSTERKKARGHGDGEGQGSASATVETGCKAAPSQGNQSKPGPSETGTSRGRAIGWPCRSGDRRLAHPARRLLAARRPPKPVPKLSGMRLPGKQAFYVPAGAVTRLQVGPFDASRRSRRLRCASARPGLLPRGRRNSR